MCSKYYISQHISSLQYCWEQGNIIWVIGYIYLVKSGDTQSTGVKLPSLNWFSHVIKYTVVLMRPSTATIRQVRILQEPHICSSMISARKLLIIFAVETTLVQWSTFHSKSAKPSWRYVPSKFILCYLCFVLDFSEAQIVITHIYAL